MSPGTRRLPLHKLRPLLLLTSFGLLLTVLFQNCLGPSVDFNGNAPQASYGGGNGTGYDGKPDNGTYVRIVPDYKCGDQLALFGEVEISDTKIVFRSLDPQTCKKVETTVTLDQLEFARYNAPLLAYDRGVFERSKTAPVLNDRNLIVTEAWCRLPSSSIVDGLDIVVRSGPASATTRAQVLSPAFSDSHDSLNRQILSDSVKYTGPGFSLTLKMKDAPDSQSRVVGQFTGLVQGQERQLDLVCRTGSKLDPQSPVPPLACPIGYERVTLPSGSSSTEVCIAKYEAKQKSFVAVSEPVGLPWVKLDRSQSMLACQGNGLGYDLIRNSEWTATARDIESVAQNWSTATIGSAGGINQGHSSGASGPQEASPNDDDACYGTNQTCSSNQWANQRRTHFLSSGSVIWDLAGNVDEWMADDNSIAYGPDGTWISQLTDNAPFTNNPKSIFGPIGNYTPLNSGVYGGLGQASLNHSTGAITRGGDALSQGASGIFSVNLNASPSDVLGLRGFRCVYHP